MHLVGRTYTHCSYEHKLLPFDTVMALSVCLQVERIFEFHKARVPGYEHKRLKII